MKHYPYLIVGGGMTADYAVAGIRELDSEKEIMVISEENDPPYDRPPLSKSLWKNTPLEKIWRNTADKNADILLGQRVMQIRPEEKIVVTNSGREFNYGKLLLATGAKKRKLPFGGEDILYFRTVEDYKRLREISERKARFAVIGTGFIGSEIAAALAMNGKEITVIDFVPGIGANIFPPAMTQFLNNYFLEKGVNVIPNVKVSNVNRISENIQISLDNGKTLEVDCVVAGVGVLPDTELADAMHLSVENGIRVNEFLQTSTPDIYAAGDVANFYNPLLAKRLRVEHADNAKTMGKQAGA